MTGTGREGRGSVANNNGRSSAIADRLKVLVGRNNLEITKMTDHFSHTKKGISKLLNLKDFFFPNFIIQLYLSFFHNSADTRIHKKRVFSIFVYKYGTRVDS